ncbi:glycosyltransferase family A protein [Vibrio campbellii]|uniref:glycosyltransferase family A protein n=1 Tax=Vibrio campbellii TaxID=680 RepID=UPI00210A9E88|nr:glycosyltransferase family A protein [Vibrio campbellii]UTZ40104.1 glycosyltransferase family 2 protein [Vibrio campbellii]
MNKATIDVLISTMGDGINRVYSQRHPIQSRVRYILVHQVTPDYSNSSEISKWLEGREDIIYLPFIEKGLSNSRNRALDAASAEIVMFCDDDVCYLPSAYKIVRNTLNQREIDIATFKVQTPEGEGLKNYSEHSYQHNWRSVLKVSSIEVAAKRESIKNIRFDTYFGLGTALPASEENIFLLDCLKQGLKLQYVPSFINLHPKESSGRDWSNQAMRSSKLTFFYRCFGLKAIPLFLVFAIKKRSEYQASIGIADFISENISRLIERRKDVG